jgi:threonine dehydratase
MDTETLQPRERCSLSKYAGRSGVSSQIPGYKKTPSAVAAASRSNCFRRRYLVKDESRRLELNSFKILGGFFAIYRYIQKLLALPTAK